jgi:hypothetical protein
MERGVTVFLTLLHLIHDTVTPLLKRCLELELLTVHLFLHGIFTWSPYVLSLWVQAYEQECDLQGYICVFDPE